MLYSENHMVFNRITSLAKFEGKSTLKHLKKNTKGIPTCVVVRALYILYI